MSDLEIRLLGPFQLKLGGEVVTEMRSDKVRALLAYLAVEADQPHRREKLAGLLWPGYPEDSARASLRRALADLRQALRPALRPVKPPAIDDESVSLPYLVVTRQTIQFDRNSDAWVDVNVFSSLTRKTKSVDEKTILGWEEAVALYRREFMEGFSLPDSAEYEEWLLVTREQLKRQELETLERLVESLDERGEYRRGLGYAWRAVELDPLRESAQRGLLRLLALSGQREAAITQYDVYSRVLVKELGVEPSVETQQLIERIQREEWPPVGQAEMRAIERQPRSIGASPYRGLAAFREEDAPFFFGREDFTQQVLEVTRTLKAVAVILGSSGSGKSSVVYAGVIPRLRSQGDWLIVELRPGTYPIHSLSGALLPLLEPELSETDRLVESQKLAAALNDGALPLHHLVERVLEKDHRKTRLLLFIDQFEELYTLCSQPETRQSFLKCLLETIDRYCEWREHSLALLLTMRADFMGQALSHRQFADVLQHSSIMLGPMTLDELRAAIEKPAELQGAAFEAGLVERILEDVGDEPGNLPLLEFALTLLWEKAQSGWLTHEAYEEIGEIKGSLARYAEQVYGELDDDDQGKAQRVFLQLVRPGEGTEDTRRVASRAEIGEENWSLVQHLADKRLVVTGRDVTGKETIEVVHEALIGNWERLRSWIDAERAFRVWQECLRVAIRQWEATGEDEGALLRGAPLAEAEGWLVKKEPDLSLVEVEFIYTGQKFQQRRQEERERSRRRVFTGLSIGLIVTLFLAVFAAWQWRFAQQSQKDAVVERDQTRVALSKALAARAEMYLDEELDLATLLSVEAVKIDPSVEARASLADALGKEPQLISYIHGYQDRVRAVAFSPGNRFFATGDAEGGLYLRQLIDSEDPNMPDQALQLRGHTTYVSSLAFSPDGRWLASGGFDDVICLWDISSGERAYGPLTGHRGNLWALTFSPDGTTLVSGAADGQILLWQFGSSQPISQTLVGGLGIVSSLAFSPGGDILAYGTSDGSVILWDMLTSEPFGEPMAGHDRLVRALAFSPDGKLLASGSDDSRIVLWDADRDSAGFGQQVSEPLVGHDDWIRSLVFNAANDVLISAAMDGRVLSWDLTDLVNAGESPVPVTLFEAQGLAWGMADSPDGRWLVTGGEDYFATLWDLGQIHPLAQLLGTHEGLISDLDFSPDNQILASSDERGNVILWDVATRQPLLSPFIAHTGATWDLDYSPDGKILASAGEDNLIHLWDADPGSETFGKESIPPLSGHSGDVTAVAFHPDGKILSSGGGDRSLIFWDTDRTSGSFGGQLAKLPAAGRSLIFLLSFDQAGNRLVSLDFSGIILWDTSSLPPTVSHRIEYPSESPSWNPEFLRPDIFYLVVENKIVLIDLNPSSGTYGEFVAAKPIVDPAGWINGFDQSPDGLMLASGDGLGSHIQLWDLSSTQLDHPILIDFAICPSQLPYVFEDDTCQLNLRFSLDGAILASGDIHGNVILWDLDLEHWIKQACRRANRNLTQEEWQRYFGDQPYRATCSELFLEPTP